MRVRKNVYTVLGVDSDQTKEREKKKRVRIWQCQKIEKKHKFYFCALFWYYIWWKENSVLVKNLFTFLIFSSILFVSYFHLFKYSHLHCHLKSFKTVFFFVKVYSNMSWFEFCANLFLRVLKIQLGISPAVESVFASLMHTYF